jgi:hypothetical protein
MVQSVYDDCNGDDNNNNNNDYAQDVNAHDQ